MMLREKYTLDYTVKELKELVKKDIPEEYRAWADDGITYVDRYPAADVQDYPNSIFNYMKKEPMPSAVRELVEGILLQGIDEGSNVAACNLGSLYYTGMIGEQSYTKAKEYYGIAAENGDYDALENLGFCYYYAKESDEDLYKAFTCFAKGAFLGRGTSLYMMADMYRKGEYVTKDERTAYHIYSNCIDMISDDSEAAEEYRAEVYVRYAECYLTGTGCETDSTAALFWAQRAEFEFRVREKNHRPYAREGIVWAMHIISECRALQDKEAGITLQS